MLILMKRFDGSWLGSITSCLHVLATALGKWADGSASSVTDGYRFNYRTHGEDVFSVPLEFDGYDALTL